MSQKTNSGIFSPDAASHVVEFIERYLVQTTGEWSGEPFMLMDWQRHGIFEPLFGTLNSEGFRQYRTAFVEVPRKNGKSTIAAAVALYLLIGDDEDGAEIYGAAQDRDQAGIVFRTAAEMVRRSPILSKHVKVIDSTKRITFKDRFYRVIAADAAGSHGYNAHGIIFDEVHTQKSRDLWDVLQTSKGARRQPLTFAITTAGHDRNSICYELHDYALKVQKGLIDDPTFFSYVKSAPSNADWGSPDVWREANPGYGVTIKESYLAEQAARAREVAAYENTFRNLHLNQWTQQATRWLQIEKWDACLRPVDEKELLRKPCYAGLDLAQTTDIAALVLVFPLADGSYHVQPHFWVPEERIRERSKRDRVPYETWAKQGLIEATSGNVIDYRHIRMKIDELAKKYRIIEIGYDPWNATEIVQWLIDGGMEMVPVRQGWASMSPPMKAMEALILQQRLAHDGNPVLRWMADNLVVKVDPAGNLKPDKERSQEKIDGMVALLMGLDRAVRSPERTSVYERNPLFVMRR